MPTISFSIDIVPTLLLISVILATAVIAVLWRAPSGHTFIPLWAGGCLMVAIGILGIVLGTRVPELFSILVANLSIILSYVLFGIGSSRHLGRSERFYVIAGAVFAAAFVVAYFGQFGLNARVAIVSAGMAVFGAHSSLRFLVSATHPLHLWAALLLAGFAALGVIRVLDVVFDLAAILPDGQLHSITLALGTIVTGGFALSLLVAGVRLRRTPMAQAEESADWMLDAPNNLLVTPSGQQLKLTSTERVALQALVREGQIVPRADLIAAIGRDPNNPKDRAIDVLISRLRRKSADAGSALPISSIRGQGYIFSGRLRVE